MSHVPVGAKGAAKGACCLGGRFAEPTNAADDDLLVRTGMRADPLRHCGCGCHRVMCDW
ncbi:hypothetical protein [Streptomyces sp. NRRL WC-3618]|uniref:hypothetical protein n=1 Tax=Streptomyces sp. NRRL WC-3618 TaxID=1519490 RepID=UPI000A670272|nr:hypothetical protein [Streptomyces sp. NRRL WC-3618]